MAGERWSELLEVNLRESYRAQQALGQLMALLRLDDQGEVDDDTLDNGLYNAPHSLGARRARDVYIRLEPPARWLIPVDGDPLAEDDWLVARYCPSQQEGAVGDDHH